MKLLSVVLARSVWLASTTDLNPRGKYVYPPLSAFLIDTYKFRKYPQTDEELDESKGLVFDNGEFKNKDGEFISIKMTIFNFGVVADSRSSTNDTDFFLETLSDQLQETLNIQDYASIITGRDYLSQLHVTTDKELELIHPKFKTISEYLNENVSYGINPKYQLSSLSFWADPVQSRNPNNFIFERQLSVDFSEKRYFSSAPLPTEKHIELLGMIEEVLS